MKTREEILALAGTLWDEVRDGDDYAVSLFHAAQALAYEDAAKVCEETVRIIGIPAVKDGYMAGCKNESASLAIAIRAKKETK